MRDRQIDVLKGMGIFFVVLGHMSSPFKDWIYTFHMPLFFFVTGFLRYGSREKPWGEFLKKKAGATLIPYVAFWLFGFVFDYLRHPQRGFHIQMRNIVGLLLGGGYLADSCGNFPLWFLQLYFICMVVFEGLLRFGTTKLTMAAGLLLIPGTLWFQTLLPGRPAFHINILPAALVFMLLGYGTKYLLTHVEKLNRYKSSFLLGLVFVALGFVISLPHDTNVSEIRRLWYFPGAYCTILGFYLMGGLLSRIKLLHYLAESSLFIMGIHSVLLEDVYWLVGWVTERVELPSMLQILMALCITIAVCCLMKEIYLRIKQGTSSIFHE